MSPIIGVLIAYLAGSIPSAYLAGKFRGVDLRQHGSGNLGATNVVRVLGPRIGAVVFIVDLLKGFLPVYFLPRYTETLQPELWALVYGVAAIFGHVKPIFLLWKGGGKGVATASGVFLALAFVPMLIAEVAWIGVFYFTRYVSLASLVGAAVLPIAILALYREPQSPVFIASVIIALFVFWTHRANIGRLRRGEEHKFVKKERAA
ncbi:MAG TPA: glycerol-3-phosphate 1-O-acyltransferase PlsY [Gemmatimonadaceae bacterium]|jgi:acyl phosphate:glycerol-3-phosphate acyltransferase|nr:glycerol-3-phosphate 1-O-acyltransferase PlsY [Gemmatimonadaceae bacterium]